MKKLSDHRKTANQDTISPATLDNEIVVALFCYRSCYVYDVVVVVVVVLKLLSTV